MKHMKNFVGLCCFVFSLFLMSCSGSHLAVEDDIIDLGTIPGETKAPFEFHLKNNGNKKLSLSALIVGCHCVRVTNFPMSLSPKEKYTLKGYFSTGFRYGEVMRIIRFNVNDSPKQIFLRVKATVVPKS